MKRHWVGPREQHRQLLLVMVTSSDPLFMIMRSKRI